MHNCRSKKWSNEPEPMSIEGDHTNSVAGHASKTTKAKPKVKSKPKAKRKMKNDIQKILMKSLDSPVMGTRSKSKMVVPPSPAMSTRSIIMGTRVPIFRQVQDKQ